MAILSYWQRRAERALLRAESVEQRHEKRLSRVYAAALAQVKEDIGFFTTVASDEGWDTPTRMDAKTAQMWEELQARHVHLGETDSTYVGTEEQLRTSNVLARTRFQMLQTRIKHALMGLGDKAEAETTASLGGSYTTARETVRDSVNGWLVDKRGSGISVQFPQVTRKQVDVALATNWSGAVYSERIWKNTDDLRKWLDRELSVSLVAGSTGPELAGDLAHRFGVSSRQAARLLRTETTFIAAKASLDGFADWGIDHYAILATLDGRTSKICIKMDGLVFSIEEAEFGVNVPPFHVLCRSVVTAHQPELEELFADADLTRVARDANGKTVTVPKDMTWDEWDAARFGPRYPWAQWDQMGMSDDYAGTLYGEEVGIETVRKHLEPWMDEIEELTGVTDIRDSESQFREALKRLRPMVQQRLDGSQVAICMDEETMRKVLDSGRYKTQFETGTSSGQLSTERRTRLEDELFDIDPHIPDKYRPVYGFLFGWDEESHMDPTTGYGEVTAIFGEQVKKHTTFAMGDTLLKQGEIGLAPVLDFGSDMKDWLTLGITFEDGEPSKLFEYMFFVEAHMHGGALSADISSVVLPKNRGYSKLGKDLVAQGIHVRWDDWD